MKPESPTHSEQRGPAVASSDLLGRIRVLRDTDLKLYLLPSVGVELQTLLDVERQYEWEVMNEITTHKLWLRIIFWRYQRTVCVHLNLRPNAELSES